MTRPHGRTKRGLRLVYKVPHGHWQTATFLAGLRSYRIDAPACLVPTLRPDDIVVLDNLSSHKGKAVREAVKDAGAHLLFLPQYSPHLNPIEQLFAKLKPRVRKAAPRTFDAIADALANALGATNPTEPANYLKNV